MRRNVVGILTNGEADGPKRLLASELIKMAPKGELHATPHGSQLCNRDNKYILMFLYIDLILHGINKENILMLIIKMFEI